jgi:hypothetical protein
VRRLLLTTACVVVCGCVADPEPQGLSHLDVMADINASAEAQSRQPIGERGPCPLHGIEPKLGRIPIVYGYVVFAPGYWDAYRELFPRSMSSVLGGCMPMSPTLQAAYYCPQCREAEKDWHRLHPPASRPSEDE